MSQEPRTEPAAPGAAATPKGKHYHAFGLRVASAIALPELGSELPAGNSAPDLRIRFGDVPASLPGAAGRGVLYEAAPGRFLLRYEGIGGYYVADGTEIIISPAADADSRDIRLFLLGSAMGAVLHMRGVLPLHAAAVEVGGKAVLLTGPSGAGKSTLAATLAQRGHRLLADDICPVTRRPDGSFRAMPGCARLKLWADALDALELRESAGEKVRECLDKHSVFCASSDLAESAESMDIGALYILSEKPSGDVDAAPRSGVAKLRSLQAQIYRPRFAKPLGVEAGQFAACVELARRVAVYDLSRPRAGFSAREMADRIEKDCASWAG